MGLPKEKPGDLREKINFPHTTLEHKQVNPTTTPNGRKGFFFKKSNLWVGVQTDKLEGADGLKCSCNASQGGRRVAAPPKSNS